MTKIYYAIPLKKKPARLLKLVGGFILILLLLKLFLGIGTILASVLVGTVFGFILGRKIIIMGLFDFFKKEKPIEDPTLFNLTKGAILDYDLASWIVKDRTEYDWGNNQYTFEYTVDDGSKSMFIHIDDSTPLKIDISEPIKMFELGPLVKQTIVDTDNAPKRVSYQDKNYFLSDEFLGHCKSVDDDDDEWSEFVKLGILQ